MHWRFPNKPRYNQWVCDWPSGQSLPRSQNVSPDSINDRFDVAKCYECNRPKFLFAAGDFPALRAEIFQDSHLDISYQTTLFKVLFFHPSFNLISLEYIPLKKGIGQMAYWGFFITHLAYWGLHQNQNRSFMASYVGKISQWVGNLSSWNSKLGIKPMKTSSFW